MIPSPAGAAKNATIDPRLVADMMPAVRSRSGVPFLFWCLLFVSFCWLNLCSYVLMSLLIAVELFLSYKYCPWWYASLPFYWSIPFSLLLNLHLYKNLHFKQKQWNVKCTLLSWVVIIMMDTNLDAVSHDIHSNIPDATTVCTSVYHFTSDEGCGETEVPFPLLEGESPLFIDCFLGNHLLVLSNYRLFVKLEEGFYSLPLGLVENVEHQHPADLLLLCRDAKVIR